MVKKHKKERHTKSEHHAPPKKVSTADNVKPWQIASSILGLLFVISIFTGGFGTGKDTATQPTPTTQPPTQTAQAEPIRMTVLNDERCAECQQISAQVVSQLRTIFPSLEVEEVDYMSDAGQELYTETEVRLPAFFFDGEARNAPQYSQIQQYITPVGSHFSLNIGSTHNPTKEICDDGIDNTGDGLVDCESPDCAGVWECVAKKEKPQVELFLMSHCPYGVQMLKGMLPVVEELGDEVDFELKFVNYAMRDRQEIDEQLNMYCIQKEQQDKFIDYLNCFVEDGNGARCLTSVNIDTTQLATCVEQADAQYGISAAYADRSTWVGQFPSFSIHDEENERYNVLGSPHLVVNEAEPPAGRDPQSLLNAVCQGYEEQPAACNTQLDTATPSPGFGFQPAGAGMAAPTMAQCG